MLAPSDRRDRTHRSPVAPPAGYRAVRANKRTPTTGTYRDLYRPLSNSDVVADSYRRLIGEQPATVLPVQPAPAIVVELVDPVGAGPAAQPAHGHPGQMQPVRRTAVVEASHLDVEHEPTADVPTGAVPPATSASPKRRLMGRFTKSPVTDEHPKVYDANGVEVGDFDVVRPGAAPTNRRFRRGQRALVVTTTAVIATGVAALIGGVVLGRSAVPAQGALSAADAADYRLTTFPVDAAQAFGQQYLQVCLTHGNADDVKRRQVVLESMSTAGVASACGWTNGGLLQEPVSIVYNGYLQMIDDFPSGQAAYLGYNVSLGGAAYQTVTVPIWVKRVGTGNDMRIVGDLGITPATRLGQPPTPTLQPGSDDRLAGEITNSVLAPFFAAWGSGDQRQLNLVLAEGATENAKIGMGGAMKDPKITDVRAHSARAESVGSGKVIPYVDGDRATVTVTVSWMLPASESTQTVGYRVEVVRSGGKWMVRDVRGGSVDIRGGGSGMGSTADLMPGAATAPGTGSAPADN
jgi:hypothetical protein